MGIVGMQRLRDTEIDNTNHTPNSITTKQVPRKKGLQPMSDEEAKRLNVDSD